jgi:hypothetical protein
MNIGFSLIIALVVAINILVIIGWSLISVNVRFAYVDIDFTYLMLENISVPVAERRNGDDKI